MKLKEAVDEFVDLGAEPGKYLLHNSRRDSSSQKEKIAEQ